MLDIAIASRRLQVSEPEKIPDEGIASALAKLVDLRLAMDRGTIDRNALDAVLTDIRNRGGGHLAEAYLADPFAKPANPNKELEAAERALNETQARLAGMDSAQGLAWNEYAGAVDRGRTAWAKALAAKVPASLRKVSSAIKLLRDAEAELAENLGVLQGLSEGGYTAKSVGPGTYAIPLSQAIESAGQALAAGTQQLEAAKPGKAETS